MCMGTGYLIHCSSMKMKSQHLNTTCLLIMLACLLAGCKRSDSKSKSDASSVIPVAPVSLPLIEQDQTSPAIVAASRNQVGMTTIYDPAYVSLKYPGGDVPIERGVCTDVVIRALREAFNMDLQMLLHEDMKGAFSRYPTIWGLKKPDRNIDHRRVPNLKTYFERMGYSVGLSREPEDYLPGHLVTCTVGGNRPHIMIVSDKKTSSGVPFVIHNIGRGAKEEDRLFDFPITGHYGIKTERSSNN
jgi:uncharacterized protein